MGGSVITDLGVITNNKKKKKLNVPFRKLELSPWGLSSKCLGMVLI